jgi:hypothetical protein
VNIGDFAESLINSEVGAIKSGKKGFSPTVDKTWEQPGQPDITNIEVPSDFSSKVISESFNIETATPIIEETSLPEPKQDTRIERLAEIVAEAQQILESLGTTVGMGMVGGASPLSGRKETYRRKINTLRKRNRK